VVVTVLLVVVGPTGVLKPKKEENIWVLMAASDLLRASRSGYDFQRLAEFFFLTPHQGTPSLVSNGY
jgi:hypothetical protein